MKHSVNSERGKLARQAAALNTRHARGRGLPAVVLFTDDSRSADWVEAVRALPRGSAVIVRHREARAREALGRLLRPVCRARGVLLLIGDDPALAVRLQADGVHLPEARAYRAAGLKMLRPRWFVTAAAHDLAAVARARRHGADAVFASPAFATASHPGRAALGAVRLAAMTQGASVYALGGVETKTIRRLNAHRIVGIGSIGGWLRS
jgi:thiamine-phosphate pyrophosphorylase